MTETPREFAYRARLPSRSFTPGAHASRVRGSGLDVAAVVPLLQARDARRLDLRASLRDPFGQWWAREHHQRSSVSVVLLVDTTASVAAGGVGRPALVHHFAQALRHSAARTGDSFGLIAFDGVAHQALTLRPTRARATATAALAGLAEQGFAGRSAEGVLQAATLLPREPALVFLLSDFCWPAALLDEALAQLQRHDVVPVWLHEGDALPRYGLMSLRDAESGQQRLLWLRPALRQRWLDQLAAHHAALQTCFSRHERLPLRLADAFDADAVTDYFAARG